MYIRETIGIVDRLPITAAERTQIYSGNAERLLKLSR
jgi:predicted TIM-barrel fold metal-dependent hydrolase